jgi:hypothetical protein
MHMGCADGTPPGRAADVIGVPRPKPPPARRPRRRRRRTPPGRTSTRRGEPTPRPGRHSAPASRADRSPSSAGPLPAGRPPVRRPRPAGAAHPRGRRSTARTARRASTATAQVSSRLSPGQHDCLASRSRQCFDVPRDEIAQGFRAECFPGRRGDWGVSAPTRGPRGCGHWRRAGPSRRSRRTGRSSPQARPRPEGSVADR